MHWCAVNGAEASDSNAVGPTGKIVEIRPPGAAVDDSQNREPNTNVRYSRRRLARPVLDGALISLGIKLRSIEDSESRA